MSIIDEIEGTILKFKNDRGVQKEFDILELLGVEEERLTEHYMEQAAIMAYIGMQLAAAELELNKAKFIQEREYGSADEYYRADMDKHDKKYTEAVIKGSVMRDGDYIKKTNIVHQAEYEVALLKAILNAL